MSCWVPSTTRSMYWPGSSMNSRRRLAFCRTSWSCPLPIVACKSASSSSTIRCWSASLTAICRSVLGLQDDVGRQSDGVEALHQRLGGRLVRILGLELDPHVLVERRLHVLVLQRRFVHRQTVLAPRGPHVDEHRLLFAASQVEPLAEIGVPAGFQLLFD